MLSIPYTHLDGSSDIQNDPVMCVCVVAWRAGGDRVGLLHGVIRCKSRPCHLKIIRRRCPVTSSSVLSRRLLLIQFHGASCLFASPSNAAVRRHVSIKRRRTSSVYFHWICVGVVITSSQIYETWFVKRRRTSSRPCVGVYLHRALLRLRESKRRHRTSSRLQFNVRWCISSPSIIVRLNVFANLNDVDAYTFSRLNETYQFTSGVGSICNCWASYVFGAPLYVPDGCWILLLFISTSVALHVVMELD